MFELPPNPTVETEFGEPGLICQWAEDPHVEARFSNRAVQRGAGGKRVLDDVGFAAKVVRY